MIRFGGSCQYQGSIQPTVLIRYHFIAERSLDICNLRHFLHWNFLSWLVMYDRRSLFNIKFAFDSRRNGLIWFVHTGMYHIDNRCYAEMLQRLFNMKCIIVILNGRQLQTTHIPRVMIKREVVHECGTSLESTSDQKIQMLNSKMPKIL